MDTRSCKVIIPVWGRLYPLERHVEETSKLFDYLYIVSPEDPYFVEVMDILDGKEVIFCKNEPISEKINFGIDHCDTDYIMNCGSDDILFDDLYYLYENENSPFVTINCRILEKEDGEEEQKVILGAGRRVLRDFAVQMYPPCNRRMDTMSMQVVLSRMRKMYRREVAIGRRKRSDYPNLKILDTPPMLRSVYTGNNITKW